MSTSLLCHGFSIRGYKFVRTAYQDGQVIFTIHQAPAGLEAAAAQRGQDRGAIHGHIGGQPGAVATYLPKV